MSERLLDAKEVAEHEAGDEGHGRQQPADRGGAKRHPASLADPRTAGQNSVRAKFAGERIGDRVILGLSSMRAVGDMLATGTRRE